MQTTNITGLSGGFEHAEEAVRPGEMGKEEFLRLLTTQLSNQDPMNPMNGQEFAAQLAQFTSVEQLLNIQQTLVANGELNGMLAQGINSGVASGLIGREIEATGDRLYWDGSGINAARMDLSSAATDVKIVLRDEAGAIVRTLELGARDAGKHDIAWDGKDQNGSSVPKGNYSIEVVATDSNGDSVSADTLVSGRVDRVSFAQEGIKLWIGDLSLPMGSVQSVKE